MSKLKLGSNVLFSDEGFTGSDKKFTDSDEGFTDFDKDFDG
jgi:hypothetical protein